MARFTVLVCESLTSPRANVIYIVRPLIESGVPPKWRHTRSVLQSRRAPGGQVQNAYITIKLATVGIFSRIHGAGQIPTGSKHEAGPDPDLGAPAKWTGHQQTINMYRRRSVLRTCGSSCHQGKAFLPLFPPPTSCKAPYQRTGMKMAL